MKRYITAIAAVLMVAATFAFKAPDHSVDMYVFEYSGTYASGHIQTLSNWTYAGKNLADCNNVNTKACRVFVTEDDVDDPDNPTALNNTVSITEGGSGSNIYVAGVSGSGSTDYSNKSN